MNQSNSKDLILTKTEAQNLQADIFELLTQIAALTIVRKAEDDENAVIGVNMDGGGF